MEIIISAYNKNPEILLNIGIYIENDKKDEIFSDILSKIKEEDINYEIIVKNIISVRPKFIKDIFTKYKFFSEILINNIKIKIKHYYNMKISESYNFDIYYNLKKIKSFDILLDDINKNFLKHNNYSDLVITILSFCPDLIKKIDQDNINYIEFKNFSEIVIKSDISQDNKLFEYLFNKYSDNLLEVLNNIDNNEFYYKDLVICMIHTRPDFIDTILEKIGKYKYNKNFGEIVINSIENVDKIVNYLYQLRSNFSLDLLLDCINTDYFNHDNYKDLVICIIHLRPDLITTIEKYHKDFGEIVINSIREDKNLNSKLVNYIFEKHGKEFLLSLLKKFFNHSNYKNFAVSILCKNPDLIATIEKDHKDFTYIIINSILDGYKINYLIVNNLLKIYGKEYIKNLLDDINANYLNHDNYRYLVSSILYYDPKLIDNIDINHNKYVEIINDTIGIGINDKDKIYCNVVNYLSTNKNYDYIKDIYDKQSNIGKSNELAICILNIYPEFIKEIVKKVDIDDFLYIIMNCNKNHKNYCEIIKQLKLNTKSISNLFDNINTKYKYDHNYKYWVICIISVHPDLIQKIEKDHKDFSYIIINSIKNVNEIVDYLKKLDIGYIYILLDEINLNYLDHDNSKDLVICILSIYPEIIDDFLDDFPNIKSMYGDEIFDLYYNNLWKNYYEKK